MASLKPMFKMVSLTFLLLVCWWQLEAAIVTPHGTAYFSPEDHVEKRLIDAIHEEKESLYICVYHFTHRGIVTALIDAKKRGVEVEVVVDQFAVKGSSPLHRLNKAGIPVYVWDPYRSKNKKIRRPVMNHKFCVFGTEKVWTGSFNFTYESARLHQENVLVMEDETLAQGYKNQFHTIKHRSCTPLGSFLASHPNKRPKK